MLAGNALQKQLNHPHIPVLVFFLYSALISFKIWLKGK